MTDLYDAADVYDLQYESYRDDVPHYLSLAADEAGPVLELGCGTGRLTEALVRAGSSVTGVELSAAMIDRARARLGSGARLVHGDMRQLAELPLDGGPFGLVLAPFNVLMHLYNLDDQDLTLSGVYAQLQPGGMLALDLYVPRFGPLDVLRVVPEWSGVAGPGGQVLLQQEHDVLKQLVHSHYLLDSVGADGLLRRNSVSLTQRYWHRFELERALRAAGFAQIRLYGGFDRGRFDESSTHMVLTCRRPAG